METTLDDSRAAYSPAEFAKCFGKHPSWAYRLLYDGKIAAIPDVGRILIPASERDRLVNSAKPYNRRPRPKQLSKPDAD